MVRREATDERRRVEVPELLPRLAVVVQPDGNQRLQRAPPGQPRPPLRLQHHQSLRRVAPRALRRPNSPQGLPFRSFVQHPETLQLGRAGKELMASCYHARQRSTPKLHYRHLDRASTVQIQLLTAPRLLERNGMIIGSEIQMSESRSELVSGRVATSKWCLAFQFPTEFKSLFNTTVRLYRTSEQQITNRAGIRERLAPRTRQRIGTAAPPLAQTSAPETGPPPGRLPPEPHNPAARQHNLDPNIE